MNPFSELSDDNKQQMVKYLRFFRAKRDGILRGLSSEFEDSRQDRLRENMFTKEDMLEFADVLESNVKAQMSQEISTLINMSALAINEILDSAQQQGAVVVLETAMLESEELVRSVDKISLEAIPSDRKRGTVQLTSFKDESKSLKEEVRAAKDETSRLEDSNKMLQNRFSTVQNDATKLAREKVALQNEVADLKKRLEHYEHMAEAKGSNDRNSSAEVQRLRAELQEEREINSRRVAETPQFMQMKKLMQNQTTKIKDLRKRLSRYEPDDSKMDDDEDA